MSQTLQSRLAQLGYEVTVRSIQRDLNSLSSVLPLTSDGAKRQGWSWMADGGEVGLMGMDAHEAMTLKLVQGQLAQLLPAATLEHLQPYFTQADRILTQRGGKFAHWPDKVCVLPKGQPLLAPQVDPEVQAAVYEALLVDCQLDIEYQRRDAKEPKRYPAHPVALVLRGQISYLLCMLRDYADISQIALHRIKSARLVDAPVRKADSFNLDAYISQGKLGFAHGGQVRLEAEFDERAVQTLMETPLSEDQALIPDAEGSSGANKHWRLTATVNDTGELDTWLNGFGKLCLGWCKLPLGHAATN
ncbi:helix-turn-helix transcriptional regulator [Laribacter hongkongensis]|uniref:helix-turn-helix transcriptional regulator n=1 Tax=Laribacter hongkongensis TaxID=168471 RepID=UPI001EFE7579|nr:WYL domain-containing protein [Laribacter hongkongensis]MCG9084271.1 WYL domain-containing protein [Laribacter hongkongensis]